MGSREPGLTKDGRWEIMFCFQGVGGLLLLFSGGAMRWDLHHLWKAWRKGGANMKHVWNHVRGRKM